MRWWLVLASLAGLPLGGCSGPRFVARSDLTFVEGGQLPPPVSTDVAGQTRAVVLGPADQLAVDVFGIQELSRAVQVDANGQISLPLAGTVDAAGRTPQDLATLIAERLRAEHVREPRVTVNVTDARSQTMTVDGEVEEPGIYPVAGGMTLMRAVARAKGVTEFARQNHVVVFRTVDNQRMAALYDLRAIRLGAYEDPEIYANDVVVVGESQARRIFSYAHQGSALLTTPIIALIQR